MSGPNPAERPDLGAGMSINRRASEGDILSAAHDDEDRTGKQASASPTMHASHLHLDGAVDGGDGIDGDEFDYTDHFRDLSLEPRAAVYSPYQPVHEQPFQPFPSVTQHPYPYLQHQPGYPHQPHSSPYPHLAYYEAPASADYTLDGMPGYQARPRSDQPAPMNPSPPFPHGPQSFSRPSTATQASYGSMWGSPPMSPVAPPMQFNSIGAMGRGRHARHGSFVDELGATPAAYYGTPAWNGPPSSYAYYAPFQAQPGLDGLAMASNLDGGEQRQTRGQEWPSGSSPAISQQPFNPRGSWNPPPPQQQRQANRMSWSGPSRPSNIPVDDRPRKAYHPQPPAKRSDWVMWVGNVPPNTSHEELWKYFNSTVPTSANGTDEPWRGPSSIFLISRSSCAFVNLSSQADLDRAVAFFNGKSLRPWDPRCPRMVCRVRRKDDDLRAGVGAQRGTGMHREWVKQQVPPSVPQAPLALPLPTPSVSLEPVQTPSTAASSVPPSPAILEHPPDGDGRRRESIVDGELDTKHKSTNSYASTNSSFLARHFPKRIFILKSITTAELEESAKTGIWRTQKHNEPILDQAFRTSSEVFLIFGANRSGEFFGYAKMIEPIDKDRARSYSSKMTQGSGSGSGSGSSVHGQKYRSQPPPERIKEEDEERTRAGSDPAPSRPLLSPIVSRMAVSSPGEITPGEEVQAEAHGQRHTDPSPPKLLPDGDSPGLRANTLDPKTLPNPYFPPAPSIPTILGGEKETERQEALGSATRPPELDGDGVLRKDTFVIGEERQKRVEDKEELGPEGWGQPFNVQWIRVGSLPFNRTRHLRNPWNADREVKVSRDGTEVEPAVGALLMAEWDKMGAQSLLDAPQSPKTHLTSTNLGEHHYPTLR